MKKEMRLLSFVILAVLAVSFVSAEIIASQPAALYNAGDLFKGNIVVNPSTSSNGFLTADLICDGSELELLKLPLSLNAGEQKNIEISTPLNEFLIGNSTGQCFIRASFDGESKDSSVFEITREVSVNLDMNGFLFSPGQSVSLTGTAIKKNGAVLNGFFDLNVENTNLTVNGLVQNGIFNASFVTPNIASGNYQMNVRVYQKDDKDNVINEGIRSETVQVKQVARNIALELSSKEINPTEEVSYTARIYDQVNDTMKEDVGIILSAPNGKVYSENLVKSNETNILKTEFNTAPGSWEIELRSNGMSVKDSYYVKEVLSADFEIINSTLYVKNTGNVPYNKTILIKIGDKETLKEIQGIAVNGTKGYALNAETGNYTVLINDGAKTQNFDGVSIISGNAISLQSLTSKGMIVGWIVLIVVLLGIWYYYGIFRKQKYFGKEKAEIKPIKINPGKVMSAGASDNLIENGQREESSIISLKIRNYDEINKEGSITAETFGKMMEIVRQYKGKMRIEGDYRTIVFSKLITGEEDNSTRAVKAAKEIKDLFEENNKRFTHKIQYGIGLHLGDLIVELKAGQFNFSSTGNTITIAKRVAETSRGDVLLSEPMRRRTVNNVKCERVNSGFYKFISLKDKAQHSGFIKGFVARQEDEKKGFWK